MEIKGKKAVICGGASGMAKATAQLLRQKGADIAILDLPSSAGAEVAKELDGTFHEVDILDENQTESAISDAVERAGRPAHRGQHGRGWRRASGHCPRTGHTRWPTSGARSS